MQDVYGPEIARAKQPAEKLQLAQKLLQAAVDEGTDVSGRYMLLTLAVENASAAGNIEIAFKAIDQLGNSYLVDGVKLKTEAAIAVSKSVRSPEDRKDLVFRLDPLIQESLVADRYDLAKQLAELAVATARMADPALAKEMGPRVQQIRDAQAAYYEAEAAAEALKGKPNDPDANLKVGKFRCFVKRDWKDGLPLLALGRDEPLKGLAQQELAGATAPDKQVALGDGWWDEAEKLTGPAKLISQQRAAQWYQQALGSLDKGLLRQKLEHRLEMVPAQADSELAGTPNARAHFDWTVENVPRFERLDLVRSWDHLRPKTTLAAQRIEGSFVLTRQNSPYLVTGMLLVAQGATLTIEPGAIVLFSPEVKLQVDGTLKAVSDGPWIVLAAADGKSRWGGVESREKMDLRRCVIVNAEKAASQPLGSLTAEECILADNGTALDIGNNGGGTVKNCLLLRNDLGLTGHGDAGHVTFTRCLLLFNKRGCTANFWGKCEGSNCTFYGNETAIEAADMGNSVRISLSNIITTTGKPLGTRGGKATVAGNYWGKRGAPSDSAHDCSGPLDAPVKDAIPSLPQCEYLSIAIGLPVAISAAARPNHALFLSPERAVGVWAEGNGRKYVLTRDGRFMFTGNTPGFWKLTSDGLYFTWLNKSNPRDFSRVDSYTSINGDKIRGKSWRNGNPVIEIEKVGSP